jgi:hypothetical protein
MYSYTLPSTSAIDGMGGQRHAPAALPPVKTRYPLYRGLGAKGNIFSEYDGPTNAPLYMMGQQMHLYIIKYEYSNFNSVILTSNK